MSTKQHTVLGILAHVDAGKTTLSEGILFQTGAIRKAGRVDHQDTFLDTEALEKQRGITIFSKQAEFTAEGCGFTLLDTPGHVDFSAEMERTLQVLDAAILVISAPEGVNGRVRALWKLLAHYQVPAFLFVNKLDQPGTDLTEVLADLQKQFGGGCIDFCQTLTEEAAQEALAVCDEAVLETYLEGTPVGLPQVMQMVRERKVFPVYSGTALHMEGIEALIGGLTEFAKARAEEGTGSEKNAAHMDEELPIGADSFSASVFKISRDPQGTRLTWIRLLSGTLRVRQEISCSGGGEPEKIDQIRIYSGSSYEMVQELEAGRIAALTGLSQTRAGTGLGTAADRADQLLQPVYMSAVQLRDPADRPGVLKALRILEEEEPLLHIRVNEETGEIQAGIMGEVQTEILQSLLQTRFGLTVSFGDAAVAYRETIAEVTEGVGHFEPLRHYAEVHLLMEPGEPGSGLSFQADCSTDSLALNWQRLILTHLEERTWQGVLTGSDLTDMRITVIGGRAHEKHTEGGDFRQATYRAVRQGLMSAESILLEPYYHYELQIPSDCIGRAMSDLERMGGTIDPPDTDGQNAVLTGTVPAAQLRGYQTALTSYTSGQGQLNCSLAGYFPCRNAEQIIEETGYEPDADLNNPSASVFCSHGAGVLIPWDQVRAYMHVDTGWRPGLIRLDGRFVNPEGDAEHSLRDAYGGFAGQRNPGSGADAEADGGGISAAAVQNARRTRAEAAVGFKEREQRKMAAEQELKEIFERTYGAVRTRDGRISATLDRTQEPDDSEVYDQAWRDYRRQQKAARTSADRPDTGSEARRKKGTDAGRRRCLLVDGYNIIFAWKDLRELAEQNVDAARDALMDRLSAFQGYDGCLLILVFDAWKVRGGERKIFRYHNINVVFTCEAETADAYIEKTVHEMSRNYQISVATSDGLEQMIILGEGAARISARDLAEMLERAGREAEETMKAQPQSRSLHRVFDGASAQLAEELETMRRGTPEES